MPTIEENEDQMLLYHGTNEKVARRAIREGIKTRNDLKRARRKHDGNWVHTIQSNPDRVYMTDTYPLYFAAACMRGRGRGAILEIDTDLLEKSNLVVDEDVLEQAMRGRDGKGDMDMEERTRYYRDEVVSYEWEKSLSAMGTCAHVGSVPVSAITRVCYVDPGHPSIMIAMDASISMMNYKFCSPKYKLLTSWLFGEIEEVVPNPDIPEEFQGIGSVIILPKRTGQKGLELVDMRKTT